MTDETIHKSTRTVNRQAIASYLHRLADAFAAADPIPVDDAVTVDPPASAELEVDVERVGSELTFELEFAWPDADTDVKTGSAVEDDLAVAPDATPSTNRQGTFELYQDVADEWRWRLRHANGNVIADGGEGYSKKANAVNGIESVKKNAPGATIDEQD